MKKQQTNHQQHQLKYKQLAAQHPPSQYTMHEREQLKSKHQAQQMGKKRKSPKLFKKINLC